MVCGVCVCVCRGVVTALYYHPMYASFTTLSCNVSQLVVFTVIDVVPSTACGIIIALIYLPPKVSVHSSYTKVYSIDFG